MNHFDERSGVVICPAPWGSWWQTIDDVCIEVNVPPGTTAKEIKCKITAHSINLVVAGKEIVKVYQDTHVCTVYIYNIGG